VQIECHLQASKKHKSVASDTSPQVRLIRYFSNRTSRALFFKENMNHFCADEEKKFSNVIDPDLVAAIQTCKAEHTEYGEQNSNRHITRRGFEPSRQSGFGIFNTGVKRVHIELAKVWPYLKIKRVNLVQTRWA